MERDEDAEASEAWLETYSSLAENFISKVMQKKGILLNYTRDTLRVAKEYAREEFRVLGESFARNFLPLRANRTRKGFN